MTRTGMGVRLAGAALGFVVLMAAAIGAGTGPLAVGTALAQSDIIDAIRVEGNQRIEDETILSYMKVAPGDMFNRVGIDRSLKSLFDTGLFADVVMRRDGAILVVKIVENPIINRLAFEGNRRIEDQSLAGEVQLRPRIVYTRSKVQRDVARIQELYRRSGRFAATVEPKVIQLNQNRVDLVFEINEGTLTGVQRIAFVGNDNFADSTLREQIQTRQTRWWRFFATTDNYDPDRLSFDRELLRRFYLREGFADFRVVSAVAELTPDRENFYVTFTIEEGERYTFGEIELTTVLPGLDVEPLESFVTTGSEDWYNAEEIEETIQAITDEVTSQGYAFVDVAPKVDADRESLTVDVVYSIEEGPRVYVQRIDITGNERTLDRVIRRNVRLAEGDAFNSAKIRRSRTLINNLGFFSRVDISNEAGDEPDQSVVTIDVEEQSTGEVTFGAGFSTVAGPTGSVGIRERNLLGRGQDLSLNFTISGIAQNIQLSFTEPFFLDRNVAAGFDVFNTTEDFDESAFERDRTGFVLRAGYPLSENLSQSLRYSLRSEEIKADDFASIEIKEQEGTTLTSSVGQSLHYDRLDSRQNPTEGYFARWSVDLAGVGGDQNWVRNTLEAGYYFPFWGDWVISTTGDVGHIVSYANNDLNIGQRFFLGGSSFRGFTRSGIGPRDLSNNISLGGELRYTATAEAIFPIGLPNELGIKGRVFVIGGGLTGLTTTTTSAVDTGSLRVSTGIGVSWASPFGPIRIDFAKAVVKEAFDEEELISFGFGSFF